MWHEYFQLLGNGAHWMFELTLIFLFDIIIGLILWPIIKRWIRHHDRTKHGHTRDRTLN